MSFSTNRKTLLFVMPRLPFPMISGRKTSLYHYCRILSDKMGYRLVVAAFLEKGDKMESMPPFIDKLVVLKKPKKLERITNIIYKSIIKRNLPLQVSLYLSCEAKKQIEAIVKEEKPDIVMADMVRCTEYIKNVKAYRIADLDDRISLRYQRQLDTDINSINPYGAFLDTLPIFLKQIALIKPLKIMILKKEISLLREYELRVGESFDKTVFVGKEEVRSFNREIGEEKAIAVPIGVDIEYFRPSEQIIEKDNIISFLGALNVAHNASAISHFVDNIFPLVLSEVPNARLCIIGGGASVELLKKASPSVEFVGSVEDVSEYLNKSKVFVCPMLFGSGIKTKNLEAMSLGIPLVTTPVGAENITAVNGKDWYIASSEREFADKVVKVLSDAKLEHSIGLAARKYIVENFTWDVAEKQFKRIMMEI